MVLEDCGQFRDVFKQTVEGADGQLGECIVGGGKNSERTGTFEGVNETSCCEGFGQRLEMAVGNCNIDQGIYKVFLQLK